MTGKCNENSLPIRTGRCLEVLAVLPYLLIMRAVGDFVAGRRAGSSSGLVCDQKYAEEHVAKHHIYSSITVHVVAINLIALMLFSWASGRPSCSYGWLLAAPLLSVCPDPLPPRANNDGEVEVTSAGGA